MSRTETHRQIILKAELLATRMQLLNGARTPLSTLLKLYSPDIGSQLTTALRDLFHNLGSAYGEFESLRITVNELKEPEE